MEESHPGAMLIEDSSSEDNVFVMPDMRRDLRTNRQPSQREEHYESGSGLPKKTPVVLGTYLTARKKADGPEPLMEYRVGIVEAGDFKLGLRCPFNDQYRLNPVVARKCFGTSPILLDKDEAIELAQHTLLDAASCGVKVLNFNELWPGTDCRIIELKLRPK